MNILRKKYIKYSSIHGTPYYYILNCPFSVKVFDGCWKKWIKISMDTYRFDKEGFERHGLKPEEITEEEMNAGIMMLELID